MAIFNSFLYVYQRVFINPLHPFASSIRYKVIPSYSHSDIDHRDIHLLWHIIIITYHRWIHQLSPFTIAIQCINAVNHRCIYHKQHISHRTCALKCAKRVFFLLRCCCGIWCMPPEPSSKRPMGSVCCPLVAIWRCPKIVNQGNYPNMALFQVSEIL